jgi:hypothetical protein
MSSISEQQMTSGINAVCKKAATDPTFRELCVSDAKAAIKKATGMDVPPGVKVKFVDAEGANYTFILPEPLSASGELKDEDLERVAGGAAKQPSDTPLTVGGSDLKAFLASKPNITGQQGGQPTGGGTGASGTGRGVGGIDRPGVHGHP